MPAHTQYTNGMDTKTLNAARSVIDVLTRTNAKRATVFISARLVVRATRRHPKATEFVLKIGKPNYLERDFVKMCKKAGEPLPVKKVQIKFYPKKQPSK